MPQHVTVEGSSDAAPPPDLASLMLTAMSLGAATSHVSRTTREEYDDRTPDRPTTTSSTCVSFTFYSPSVPSPYVRMDRLGNTRPSTPFSDGSTDFEEGFTTISSDFMPIVDDPCASINTVPNSTIPPSATGARRPSDAAANARGVAALNAWGGSTQPSTHADIGGTPGIGSTPLANTSAALPAAALSTTNVNPAPALSAPVVANPAPTASANPIPMQTEGRWYCVTIGRQVGVFRGAQNVVPLVNRVSGACYPRYSSQAAAQAAFAHALENNQVHVRE